MLLHLFLAEQRTQTGGATVNPFCTLTFLEEHLNEASVHFDDASVQPFAIPFGYHALTLFYLNHWPLGLILHQIGVNEGTRARMNVIPYVFRRLTD